jgi:hypothetical protein
METMSERIARIVFQKKKHKKKLEDIQGLRDIMLMVDGKKINCLLP